MKEIEVLGVDDSEDDRILLQHAFRKNKIEALLRLAADGQEAIDYLDHIVTAGEAPYPALILLDLKMPRVSGFDFLAWRRSSPTAAAIPVAVLSSSQNRNDIERAYALGAEWFLMKPIDLYELSALVALVSQWLDQRDDSLLTRSPCHRGHPEPAQ